MFSDDTFGCDKLEGDLIHQPDSPQLGRHKHSPPCKSREECVQPELHRCAPTTLVQACVRAIEPDVTFMLSTGEGSLERIVALVLETAKLFEKETTRG